MRYSKWVLLSVLLVFTLCAQACDLCSIYMGINPNDYKNSFGIVNRYRVFQSDYLQPYQAGDPYARLSHTGTPTDQPSGRKYSLSERFVSYDLWGKFFLNQRWQLNFMMSFADNYQYRNDSLIDNVSGVGDLLGLVKYQLFNTKNASDSIKFIHRGIVGGGLKLPAGSFNKTGMTGETDPHLQPGTGSFDYLLLAEYLLRYRQVGLNTNVIYKVNTVNRNDFRFANRFNWNAALFYIGKYKKLKWMPSAGVAFESGERDRLHGHPFPGSGGEAMFGTLGIQLFYRKLSLGTTYFTAPLHEDLYDQSIQLNNKYRVISEITYYF